MRRPGAGTAAGRFEDIRPGGWNPVERIKEINRAGIDAAVLYPSPRLAAAIFATADPAYAVRARLADG